MTIDPVRCVCHRAHACCVSPRLERLGAVAGMLLLAPVQSSEKHVVFAGLCPQQQVISLMTFLNSQLVETPASAGRAGPF